MRDYGKVASTFWTGQTGRLLRKDRDAQVVALYLLTGPMSNMIGLYHLPLAMIADQTGMKPEGASKALRRVCESGFARYDDDLEHVFVPEMAAYQIGEPLQPKDKRVLGIISLWQNYCKSQFYTDFHKRYATAYHLPEPKGLRRGFQDPSKPGAGAGAGAGFEPPPNPRSGGAKETRKRNRAAADHPFFAQFYTAYPRKESRADASRAFSRLDPTEELLAVLLAAIDRQKKRGCLEPGVTRDGRSTIPHPATWLNKRRWEDDPELPLAPPANYVDPGNLATNKTAPPMHAKGQPQ